jgi:hypothetical protein
MADIQVNLSPFLKAALVKRNPDVGPFIGANKKMAEKSAPSGMGDVAGATYMQIKDSVAMILIHLTQDELLQLPEKDEYITFALAVANYAECLKKDNPVVSRYIRFIRDGLALIASSDPVVNDVTEIVKVGMTRDFSPLMRELSGTIRDLAADTIPPILTYEAAMRYEGAKNATSMALAFLPEDKVEAISVSTHESFLALAKDLFENHYDDADGTEFEAHYKFFLASTQVY